MTRRSILGALSVLVLLVFSLLAAWRRQEIPAPLAVGLALVLSALFATVETAALALVARFARQKLPFVRAIAWLTILYMVSVLVVSAFVLAARLGQGFRLERQIWSIVLVNGLYGLAVVYYLRNELSWKGEVAAAGGFLLFLGTSAVMVLAR